MHMKVRDITAGTAEIDVVPILEEAPSGEDDRTHIRYMDFDKYRIGIIENPNHETIGIKSIEVIKKFHTDEQLSKRFDYWDVEEFYE